MLAGKVIKATRSQYLVRSDQDTITCTVRGKLVGAPKDDTTSVRVGDNVLIESVSRNEGVIREILPRKSKLSRAVEGKAYKEHIIATNIDQMVIIMSVKKPAFKSGLLDRYLVIAEKNMLRSIICLNKIDLAAKKQFEKYASSYRKLNYPFYFVSAHQGEGLDDVKMILKDAVSVLVGHSGVGKSSIIQEIEPSLNLKIVEISAKTHKGKHTTSFVQLFPLSFGGYVIDTPGIRELGLWDIYRADLKKYFVEFRNFEDQCQFNDCNHIEEPACGIKQAVSQGFIFEERYRNYVNIYRDLRAAPYELIRKQ
ncbi:MAG: ribosome small subunit-dependent GTPase A [Calditrichaeota bacterium]|nr:ribosome small subunit-dependent GTPase A [Calditrichota bacterium]RQW00507.1 MAG: ribosome small subunit-dependent GTPase A [Calditrichota bacterium]